MSWWTAVLLLAWQDPAARGLGPATDRQESAKVEQLSNPGERLTSGPPQVTSPARRTGEFDAKAAAQLHNLPSTAEPPAWLATPGQGRQTSWEPLTGADKCDPVQLAKQRATEGGACELVLEDHPDTFARQEPPTSPEQTLLEFQARSTPGQSARAISRRLAQGDPGSSAAAQAMAMEATRGATPEQQPARSEQAEQLVELIGRGAVDVIAPPEPHNDD